MTVKSNKRSRGWGLAMLASAALAAFVAGCGGGGGGTTSGTSQGLSAAVSSGAITAFGSVFVNGHEFKTSHATVIDDDTGQTLSASSLEVGQVVNIKPMSTSRDDSPEAAEVHVSPLVRGYVDASSSSSTPTLTVMGQTVQLTSGTVFTDHRACVTAATPCTAVASQADLSTTSGATPGTFVAVHGYLFAGASGAQIIATLVSAHDYTAATSQFKVEGSVTAVDTTVPSVTIGTETVDLSKATCRVSGATAACSGAFKTGDVVAARGTTAPAGATFTADAARAARLLPQTAGATVEVEGKVSSVSGTNFVVRGVQVDGSALAASDIPAVGDKVEVLGTVASDGLSLVATKIENHEAAAAARTVLAGPLSAVTAGTAANTFNVTVLGQTAIVDATTHIADRTARGATFNITNFADYLSGKTPFVVLRTVADSTGTLHATGFDIVPAPGNGFVGVAGAVDADPVSTSATSATITVHGVSVVFDPSKATVAKGNVVIAIGTLTSGGAVDTTVSRGRLFVRSAGGHGDDCEIDFSH